MLSLISVSKFPNDLHSVISWIYVLIYLQVPYCINLAKSIPPITHHITYTVALKISNQKAVGYHCISWLILPGKSVAYRVLGKDYQVMSLLPPEVSTESLSFMKANEQRKFPGQIRSVKFCLLGKCPATKACNVFRNGPYRGQLRAVTADCYFRYPWDLPDQNLCLAPSFHLINHVF